MVHSRCSNFKKKLPDLVSHKKPLLMGFNLLCTTFHINLVKQTLQKHKGIDYLITHNANLHRAGAVQCGQRWSNDEFTSYTRTIIKYKKKSAARDRKYLWMQTGIIEFSFEFGVALWTSHSIILSPNFLVVGVLINIPVDFHFSSTVVLVKSAFFFISESLFNSKLEEKYHRLEELNSDTVNRFRKRNKASQHLPSHMQFIWPPPHNERCVSVCK